MAAAPSSEQNEGVSSPRSESTDPELWGRKALTLEETVVGMGMGMGRGEEFRPLEVTLVGSQVSDTGCAGGSHGRKSNLVKRRALSPQEEGQPLFVGGVKVEVRCSRPE